MNYHNSTEIISRFPKDEERRHKWLVRMNRWDSGRKLWKAGPSARLCSAHFVSGQKSEDPKNVDYVPTLFPTGGLTLRQRSTQMEEVKIDNDHVMVSDPSEAKMPCNSREVKQEEVISEDVIEGRHDLWDSGMKLWKPGPSARPRSSYSGSGMNSEDPHNADHVPTLFPSEDVQVISNSGMVKQEVKSELDHGSRSDVANADFDQSDFPGSVPFTMSMGERVRMPKMWTKYPSPLPTDRLTLRQRRTQIANVPAAEMDEGKGGNDQVMVKLEEVKSEVEHGLLAGIPGTKTSHRKEYEPTNVNDTDSGLSDIIQEVFETEAKTNVGHTEDLENRDSVPCVFPNCPVRDPLPFKESNDQKISFPATRFEDTKNVNKDGPTGIGSPGINIRLYELSGSIKIDHGSQTPLNLPTAIPGTKELVKVSNSFCDIVSSTEKSVQVELET